jgi:NitT/TauT family transport system ATP-binding protein/nitrate/nitrite transport system substrate-binding protein
MTQMIRWGQVREPFNLRIIAERVYRPDLYRRAVADLCGELPYSDYKVEGTVSTSSAAHSASAAEYFGRDSFDPDAALAGVQEIGIRSQAVDLASFALING